MTKTTYTVEPQRPTSTGWLACLPQHAKRFAVIEITSFRRGKRRYRKSRVITTTNNLHDAEALVAAETVKTKGKPLLPKLGGRFPRNEASPPIIARSLSEAEYRTIRQKP